MQAKARELARAWERRHGRAPNSRQLLHIARDATLQSRQRKPDGQVDWDALAAMRWDATIGGELAAIAPAVSTLRGPGAPATHHGREPGGAGTTGMLPEVRARVVQKALALVTQKYSM